MRVYLRLGRSIGVSLPWWLAWIPLLLWLAGLFVVALAVMLAALVIFVVDLVKLATRPRKSA